MYKLIYTNRFRKDVQLAVKRGPTTSTHSGPHGNTLRLILIRNVAKPRELDA